GVRVWAQHLVSLAECPNVFLKVSGIACVFRRSGPDLIRLSAAPLPTSAQTAACSAATAPRHPLLRLPGTCRGIHGGVLGPLRSRGNTISVAAPREGLSFAGLTLTRWTVWRHTLGAMLATGGKRNAVHRAGGRAQADWTANRGGRIC